MITGGWRWWPHHQPIGRRSDDETWMAAARGAHVNGDHEAERRYRDTARLIRRQQPLGAHARCIDGSKP